LAISLYLQRIRVKQEERPSGLGRLRLEIVLIELPTI
jgi:hypothetical protein